MIFFSNQGNGKGTTKWGSGQSLPDKNESFRMIPQTVRNPYANSAVHDHICTKQPRALNLKELLAGFSLQMVGFLKKLAGANQH